MRNKTKILLGIAALFCCVAVGVGIFLLCRYQATSAERLPNLYAETIAAMHSTSDRDGDGIDDQTDLLQNALSYVETKPKYKSSYYTGGYPDDGYGVCTDVVAFAMRGAGYNLMELVQKDIAAFPEDYAIDEPDPNIDFRRVRNLIVYFSHNATELTTDLSAIEEWQGGDIVLFRDHIGVVSDRRNEKGIPYLIHHNDPFQPTFEQDILEYRDDLIGHYRIGT